VHNLCGLRLPGSSSGSGSRAEHDQSQRLLLQAVSRTCTPYLAALPTSISEASSARLAPSLRLKADDSRGRRGAAPATAAVAALLPAGPAAAAACPRLLPPCCQCPCDAMLLEKKDSWEVSGRGGMEGRWLSARLIAARRQQGSRQGQ
jgi:hypothetical protein